MRGLFVVIFCLVPVSVRAESFVLGAGDWARPRSGETLLREAPLRQTIAAFVRQPDGVIAIAHAATDDGALWAAELRSWFVAFGVSSRHLRLEPLAEPRDTVALDVRPAAP